MSQEDVVEIATPSAALAGAILATGTAAFAPITVMIARRLFPGRRVFFARWGFFHVLLATFLLAALVSVIGAAFGLSQEQGESSGLHIVLLAQAMAFGIVGAVVAYWASRRDPDGVRCLGFGRGGHARAAGTGMVVYLLTAPGLLGLTLLWPWMVERLGEDFVAQDYGERILALSGVELGLALVLAIAVIPFLEELLFRAFLQPLLVQNFRDTGGVVLTSLVFATLHGVGPFLPIFGFSLVLGGVMLRTQRLVAVWSMHAFHNGLQLALLFLSTTSAPAPV